MSWFLHHTLRKLPCLLPGWYDIATYRPLGTEISTTLVGGSRGPASIFWPRWRPKSLDCTVQDSAWQGCRCPSLALPEMPASMRTRQMPLAMPLPSGRLAVANWRSIDQAAIVVLPSVAANLGPGRCPRPKPNGIKKTLIVCILVCGNVSPQTRYYQKLPNEMAPCDAGKYGGAKAGTYSRLDLIINRLQDLKSIS